MKVVIQRVSCASVQVNSDKIASIDSGLLLLVGIADSDAQNDLIWMSKKICNLRIFEDDNEKMNLSVNDVSGELLAVSQFTLCADTKKGNRPSFVNATKPKEALSLFDEFCEMLADNLGKPIQRGKFGAHMKIDLINDGPVTIILESPK